MQEVLLLGLVVIAAAVPGVPWWMRRSRRQGWQSLQAVHVIVNLKSGQSIDGYLVRQEGQLLFVRNAMLIGESDEPIPMDGQVIVERSEIEFIQSP